MPFQHHIQLHLHLDMNTLRLCVVAAATVLMVGCKTSQPLPVMPGFAATTPANTVVAQDSSAPMVATLVMPSDTRINAAVQAARPTIEQMLSLHRCTRIGGLARMNHLAVPGVDLGHWGALHNVPNSRDHVPHHDHAKCLSVRQVDQWEMPALNTLDFRAVFYADDSGETVNMGYTLRRMDDGKWLIQRIRGRLY